jgi:cardiolipin synthase
MKWNWREGNTVDLLINGDEFFPRVFACIRAAKREVLLETFILAEDEVGWALQKTLILAARRGVRIELTVDDYGTADLDRQYVIEMVEAGVKLHMFSPTPRLMGLRLNMFRRLHRKIAVIDGEVAFIGGINYCRDHLTKIGREAKQDHVVEVRGPVVADIHQACIDMLLCSAERDAVAQRRREANVQPSTRPVGNTRVLLALRDNTRHKTDIEQHYLVAIRRAKERLVLAHAYFFPGYRVLRALRNAARRGVKVELILQGQPDMPWVRTLSRLLYGYLLRDGVTIYEYCERALHSKLAIADRHWATVGSSNLDPLSLSLNLEANLVIDDPAFNEHLYAHLQELASNRCRSITIESARRGYWWRMPLIFLSFHFLRRFPAIAGWLPAHSPELELMMPTLPGTSSDAAVTTDSSGLTGAPEKEANSGN